ncbi:hypothetical protein DICPUDRAFT_150111 [Dictyostelium purpureum]|uniref:Uncharacterized protein n=1 Tax=Dictyostelium purpureum TaxID=5786 RepID=F0ZFG7_DICPU|nr:uncharacterized protein DICPUDRAFT_150111 [Dictyostelium purpureum]EGC37273.1 hypothetical protein DICPUDRAFT_150111 [Dictyostelium purpureum]|eukprot:XP_003286161.1 hypothetical protein DICPUDRAFT_150111 [Dictyostelium purpureum]
MSEHLAQLPLNDRVARLHDLSIKNYRLRITDALRKIIIDTLTEVDPAVNIPSEADINEVFVVSTKVFGDYMKANNIPEQLYSSTD